MGDSLSYLDNLLTTIKDQGKKNYTPTNLQELKKYYIVTTNSI